MFVFSHEVSFLGITIISMGAMLFFACRHSCRAQNAKGSNMIFSSRSVTDSACSPGSVLLSYVFNASDGLAHVLHKLFFDVHSCRPESDSCPLGFDVHG